LLFSVPPNAFHILLSIAFRVRRVASEEMVN
jgi:hypothetical protein